MYDFNACCSSYFETLKCLHQKSGKKYYFAVWHGAMALRKLIMSCAYCPLSMKGTAWPLEFLSLVQTTIRLSPVCTVLANFCSDATSLIDKGWQGGITSNRIRKPTYSEMISQFETALEMVRTANVTLNSSRASLRKTQSAKCRQRNSTFTKRSSEH